MKRLVLCFTMIVFAVNLFAQAPQKAGYQIVVRYDGNLGLISGENVMLRLSILKDSATATAAVYEENHIVVSNINGLATVNLGSGNVVSGDYKAINWAQGKYFIKTELDESLTGKNFITIETRPFTSVPYAFYATSSGSSTPGPKGNTGAKGFTGDDGKSAYQAWLDKGFSGTKGNYMSSLKGQQGPPGSSGGYEHFIGEAFGGGIIFHLWKDDNGTEHGLICSLEDISYTSVDTGQVWSNIDNQAVDLSNEMMTSWDGKQNSEDIINQAGHVTSAAQLCDDYFGAGFQDWYLPSIDELKLLWQNRFTINKALVIYSNFGQLNRIAGHYWSSTEFGSGSAFAISSQFGEITQEEKSSKHYVRPVRSF